MRKWISSVYASLFPLGAFRQLTKRASLFLPTFSTMCLFELLLTPVGLHCHQFISGQTTLLVRWARVFVISEYPQYILLDAWLLLSHWLKIREEPLQLDSGFGLVSLRLLSLDSTLLYNTILSLYLSLSKWQIRQQSADWCSLTRVVARFNHCNFSQYLSMLLGLLRFRDSQSKCEC